MYNKNSGILAEKRKKKSELVSARTRFIQVNASTASKLFLDMPYVLSSCALLSSGGIFTVDVVVVLACVVETLTWVIDDAGSAGAVGVAEDTSVMFSACAEALSCGGIFIADVLSDAAV